MLRFMGAASAALIALSFAVSPMASTARANPPAAPPAQAPIPNKAAIPTKPKAPEPPPKITGLEVGKKVLGFMRAITPRNKYTLKATRDVGYAWAVQYVIAAPGRKPVERSVFVTSDGRYMSDRVQSLRERTEIVFEHERIGRCLLDKGVRIYIDSSKDTSKSQLQALGPLSDWVVIDCRGDRMPLCRARGIEAFPSTVWPGGGEVGVHRLPWFGIKLGCK